MVSPRSLGAFGFGFMVAACLLLTGAYGQSAGQAPATASMDSGDGTGEGKTLGDFRVAQSIELGGRISAVNGSQFMYDTLVNYQSGARILEQELTMQSLTHQDYFDTLTLNSFGWGGDPEQAARLRIAKYSWYIFSGSYQHMQNYFDYDLFANPLNPPTGVPFVPILNSPHQYYNTHNLYNFDLVVLPMHRLSFRVDYNRNRFIGPSFSSVHEGTDALLNQNYNNTLNGFRFGVDFRATKKTTISYTQLFQYYTGGTLFGLNPFNSYPLPNGVPVSFGLPWFNAGSPCSTPLVNGAANPSCNGFFDYSLFQHINTSIPTEQVNIKSSSLKWLDFNGQFQYSNAQSSTPFTEIFSGLITRGGQLGSDTAGSKSSSNWSSTSTDLSAVFHVTNKLRLVEAFRLRNFSVAGQFLNLQTNFFTAAGLAPPTLLTPVFTFPPTTLSHSSSSPADIINEITANQIAQNSKQNDFQVQYDVAKFFGVRGGFIWSQYTIQPGDTYQAALGDIYFPNNANRGDCVGLPLNPNGSCTFMGVLAPFGSPTTEINRYSGVLGAWFRKDNTLRANIDAEFGGSDNWIYRIDPINFVTVTGNVTYTPRQWLSLGTNVFFNQATNSNSDNGFNQHNYTVSFTATMTPNQHWGLDLAYNFDAIQQQANVCFAGSTVPPGSFTCLGDDTLLETFATYQTHTNYGYFAFTATPMQRLTFRAGYNIVSNNGTTTSFNPLLPLGPLASTYQSPLAAVDVNIYKDVTFKAAWNYYQYGEGSFVGPTLPRYFHANNTTLALRYAF